MMDFIVVGFPRSGTSWISNLLTTNHTHCSHDPLWNCHYRDLDEIHGRKNNYLSGGISCTGLWRWTNWINGHPAKKLIIHRDWDEIQKSLKDLGFATMDPAEKMKLGFIEGIHIEFEDLFKESFMKGMWDYLTPEPFNSTRYRSLITLQVQPQFSVLSSNPNVTEELMSEMHSIRASEVSYKGAVG